jgi:hypothetical protein
LQIKQERITDILQRIITEERKKERKKKESEYKKISIFLKIFPMHWQNYTLASNKHLANY